MTLNVLKSLMEIDGKLFEEVSNKIQKEEEEETKKDKQSKLHWDMLQKQFL